MTSDLSPTSERTRPPMHFPPDEDRIVGGRSAIPATEQQLRR
ncbi:hypothetical protein A8926_6626 [Saccharopolyspora spinosa]|uniref:Uncharacterized protein n=1 Tax=Saccharopolyspora spinosa TaxID=60894 RepID=A0A2N3Y6G1_SACSN|nr:hypothetical protein A8926_6626 [Saccharopolyspora spinosa]